MTYSIKAVLIKSIEYTQLNGVKKQYDPGTQIQVDIEDDIAFVDEDHFHIEDDEYEVSYGN